MQVASPVNDYKLIPGLEKARLEHTKFYTQSLFPIELWEFSVNQEMISLIVKNVNVKEMAMREVEGLVVLSEHNADTPKVYGILDRGETYQILMEFCSPAFAGDKNVSLKQNLLNLYNHQATASDVSATAHWGWDIPNFIGTLGQHNARYKSFSKYWMDSRILPMIHEIERRGLAGSEWKKNLIEKIEKSIQLWALDSIQPRLIHGDLWGGNVIYSGTKAYLIDPSVSYGNPEQDIAMLSLFGSHLTEQSKTDILKSINQAENWKEREPFWLVYPLLVHVAIFGRSYLKQLNETIDSLPEI